MRHGGTAYTEMTYLCSWFCMQMFCRDTLCILRNTDQAGQLELEQDGTSLERGVAA